MIFKQYSDFCPVCNKKFNKIYWSQVYCSSECRRAEQKRKADAKADSTIMCPVCCKSFTKRTQNQIYCSPDCRDFYISQQNCNRPKPAIEAKCLICGEPLNDKLKKICSSASCITVWRKQTQKRYPRPKKDKTPSMTPEMRVRLKEVKEINKLRESMNLRPIRAGMIPCALCEQDFFSEDITREKMCETCKESNAGIDTDFTETGESKHNRTHIICSGKGH